MKLLELLIVLIAALAVYRAGLTVMFYPVRFWDLRKW
jgi:hypothetical protein